ncbi:MAG: hypothetical protein E7665_02910 [Ruminococcaceae bacterium]|nr:hypothetical protein [Oscillospiraceae bacterium]
MAFLPMDRTDTFSKGHTLIEVIVAAALSILVLSAVFSFVAAFSGSAEKAFISHDRDLCTSAVIDPLTDLIERSSDVVIADSDEDGTGSALLLSVGGRKVLICTSDISITYGGTEFCAACGENEVCIAFFSAEGEPSGKNTLKSPSERIALDDLKFSLTDEENGIFLISLLMRTKDGTTFKEERYVCAFAM